MLPPGRRRTRSCPRRPDGPSGPQPRQPAPTGARKSKHLRWNSKQSPSSHTGHIVLVCGGKTGAFERRGLPWWLSCMCSLIRVNRGNSRRPAGGTTHHCSSGRTGSNPSASGSHARLQPRTSAAGVPCRFPAATTPSPRGSRSASGVAWARTIAVRTRGPRDVARADDGGSGVARRWPRVGRSMCLQMCYQRGSTDLTEP